MCGIAGIFAYHDQAPPVRREELEAINARMYSRGPDGGGSWFSADGRVGLASRRLAIIDLSPSGIQPLWDVQGELVIVFNGEIYNYKELRHTLERNGVPFRTHTDTEVLLNLYRRDGPGMLGLLRGMFAFAIWDTRSRELFVARDPYGIKPLYVADDGQTLRLASQVKALEAGGGISMRRDPAAVAGFLLTGSVPEPLSIRASVRAVEAGSWFLAGNGARSEARPHASIAAIYQRAVGQSSLATLTEPAILLRERVEEAVAAHLVADVPAGVFLSAGIDSSVIAQTAARLGHRLSTFTLAFDEFRGTAGDESVLAERFARELGSEHTTRTVTRDEFTADLPRILDAMDQPTIDGVNTWFVSKAVREAGLKVALSGLGGDELFGSYPSFTNVPRMAKIATNPLLSLMARSAGRRGLANRKLGHLREPGFAASYLLQRGLFMPDELPAESQAALGELSLQALVEATIRPDPLSSFGRVATMESSFYMRNQLLRDADWASMAHSVELRTPLVDFALLRQIAPLLVAHGDQSKRAFGEDLPPYLRTRRKSGFFVPMTAWMGLPPDGTGTRMKSWAVRVLESFA